MSSLGVVSGLLTQWQSLWPVILPMMTHYLCARGISVTLSELELVCAYSLQQARGLLTPVSGTRVVCIQRRTINGVSMVVQGCQIYVGRQQTQGSWNLPRSEWANPFTIKQCGSAEAAVTRYCQWLVTQPQLMAKIPSLKGKCLGCWCSDGPCHAKVLAALADRC